MLFGYPCFCSHQSIILSGQQAIPRESILGCMLWGFVITFKSHFVCSCDEGSCINMSLQGKLTDGTVFDSSFERNNPIEFELGSGQVIKGNFCSFEFIISLPMGDFQDRGFHDRSLSSLQGGTKDYWECVWVRSGSWKYQQNLATESRDPHPLFQVIYHVDKIAILKSQNQFLIFKLMSNSS